MMSSPSLLSFPLGPSEHIKKARAGPTPSREQGQPDADRPMRMEKGDHGACSHYYYNYKFILILVCWHYITKACRCRSDQITPEYIEEMD